MAKSRRREGLLFLLYLLILFRITVFRSGWSENERFCGTIIPVPFQTIFSYLFNGNLYLFLYLFVGNLLWFVPLGIYLQRRGLRAWQTCLCALLLSGLVETAQFVLSTGVTETEDLILNTAGAMLGYGGMKRMNDYSMPREEAKSVVLALTTVGKTVATAESCTGGLLGAVLTEVPGASRVYLGGVISYAYEAKEELLGIPHALLSEQGAVCGQVARLMALEARRRLHADFGIGITGNAGPSADPNNPNVGEIYVAIASRDGCRCEKMQLNGTREKNRIAATRSALQLLLDTL